MAYPRANPDDKTSLPQVTIHPRGTTPRPWLLEPAARRAPIWPGIAGIFIMMALLLSFHQVVQGAVKQGAERNIASALLASATRECKALPSLVAINRCTGLLKTPVASTVIQTALFTGF
jgi:hypothetical protein